MSDVRRNSDEPSVWEKMFSPTASLVRFVLPPGGQNVCPVWHVSARSSLLCSSVECLRLWPESWLTGVHLRQVMVSGCLTGGSELCPPLESLCIRSWLWRKAAAMTTSRSPTGKTTTAQHAHLHQVTSQLTLTNRSVVWSITCVNLKWFHTNINSSFLQSFGPQWAAACVNTEVCVWCQEAGAAVPPW